MLNEEIYNLQLDKYIYANPDSGEFEYLFGEINKRKKIIQKYRNKSDNDLQKECIDDYDKKSTNIPLEEDHLNTLKGYKKGYYENQILKAERNILFYQIRLNRLQSVNDRTPIKSIASTNENLNWSGEEIELAELIKSLILTKKITGHTQKEVFNKFQVLFGIKGLDVREKLQTIRTRTDKKTPLLDLLQYNLTNWIDEGKSIK